MSQLLIRNRLLQFWPAASPYFWVVILDLERQSGRDQLKLVIFMNPHGFSDGVWFPNWAVVLLKVKLKELDNNKWFTTNYLHKRFL